jgi:hypothetical protein
VIGQIHSAACEPQKEPAQADAKGKKAIFCRYFMLTANFRGDIPVDNPSGKGEQSKFHTGL